MLTNWLGNSDRVLVVEYCFQFAGTGGGVDLVVGGQQVASGQQLSVAAVVGVHWHPLVGGEPLEHLRKLILGQGEIDGNRLKLVDDDQIGGVCRDDVSGIDEAQADFSVDRRLDIAPAQLQLGCLNRGVVRLISRPDTAPVAPRWPPVTPSKPRRPQSAL